MNKKNKILVGCLALLLVMSIGYALFSDTITINGTATAKGDFNITPECISGSLVDLGIKEHGYKNEVCTADDEADIVTIGVDLLYPGAAKLFTIKMTNTGSINSTFPLQIPLDTNNSIACQGGTDIEADPLTDGTCGKLSGSGTDMPLYAVQIGNGQIYHIQDTSDLSALPVEVQLAFSENGKIVLKPGNSVYYLGSLAVTSNLGNQDGGGVMNLYMKTVYNPVFEQATN